MGECNYSEHSWFIVSHYKTGILNRCKNKGIVKNLITIPLKNAHTERKDDLNFYESQIEKFGKRFLEYGMALGKIS